MSEVQKPISIGQVEEAGANLLKTDLSTSPKELRTEWRSGRGRGCLISHASICYRSLDRLYPSDETSTSRASVCQCRGCGRRWPDANILGLHPITVESGGQGTGAGFG